MTGKRYHPFKLIWEVYYVNIHVSRGCLHAIKRSEEIQLQRYQNFLIFEACAHSGKQALHWKTHHLKMYFLLSMGIFHCYVSLPKDIPISQHHYHGICSCKNIQKGEPVGRHHFFPHGHSSNIELLARCEGHGILTAFVRDLRGHFLWGWCRMWKRTVVTENCRQKKGVPPNWKFLTQEKWVRCSILDVF